MTELLKLTVKTIQLFYYFETFMQIDHQIRVKVVCVHAIKTYFGMEV